MGCVTLLQCLLRPTFPITSLTPIPKNNNNKKPTHIKTKTPIKTTTTTTTSSSTKNTQQNRVAR